MLPLLEKIVSHKLNLRKLLLIVFVINLVILNVNGRNDKKIDRCDSGFFENAEHTNYLQFTKEFVKREFAMARTFKSLHCCAKGYRSIEWFKDGKSFPWAKETSSMILYPGASNQSIYAIHISDTDAGRYTCVVKNDTHTIENSIQLDVMNSSPQVPLETFSPKTQYAKIGGSARFFCEAFVGKKDLPDIPVTIQWFSQNGDNLVNEKYQENVTREEEQIIGSFLKIPNVTSGDFGSYTCRIQIGNSPAYRLDMSVNLINALPITRDPVWLEPYILALMAAVATLLLIFFLFSYRNLWRRIFNVSTDDANMKCKSHQQALPFVPIGKRPRQRQESQNNDTVIMMNTYLN